MTDKDQTCGTDFTQYKVDCPPEALAMTIDQYQRDANKTAAPPLQEVMDRINDKGNDWIALFLCIMELGRVANALKANAFYNRPLPDNFVSTPKATRGIVGDTMDSEQRVDLLHSFIGMISESGEMAEALLQLPGNYESILQSSPATPPYEQVFLKGNLDYINLMEEGGDYGWYLALLARATRTPLCVILHRNIEKLKVRFAGKFTEQAANERNLDAERKALEG